MATATLFQNITARDGAPRRIVILGATGSIGQSTADVISGAPGLFEVEAVVGGRDVVSLARVARELKARLAVVADPSAYAALRDELAGSGIEAGAGPQATIEAALRPADLVVGAIAGAAGVEPTHAAVAAGRTVALANKECLVCAGPAFMRTAAAAGATLLPMDSEHNAIFQALGGASPSSVERMILTASGGPFRTWTREAIDAATPQQALAHPNWSMGPKITIDSASLMNKGLEVIEAHYIFGIPADRLDVLVHPQSIVHGLVTFADGAVTAGMAQPDMRVPIAHCLGFPDRVGTRARRLGNGLPTVLNAANEIAVAAFLAGQCGFRDIARCAEIVCEGFIRAGEAREPASIADALELDGMARERARASLT
jgi:1-deoxy-D-xylulose-5-phosphate reductoisomerase